MSNVVDRAVAVVEQRFAEQVGTKEHPGPQRYIMHAFVAATRDLSIPEGAGMEVAASIYKSLTYCLIHEIIIDGVSHALLLRNGKVEIQEILKATTSRISKELGIAIFTSAFSDSQAAYLKKHEMTIPEDACSLPLSAGDPPESLFDCAGILVRGLINGQCVHRCYYTTKSLLVTARKELVNGKVSSYNTTRDGRRYFPAPPTWASGTDSIEMLRKTAVRNFIKYIAVSTD